MMFLAKISENRFNNFFKKITDYLTKAMGWRFSYFNPLSKDDLLSKAHGVYDFST
jgi:hypothetical protein